MSVFFNQSDAARRYEQYRPKIHSRIVDKIRPLIGTLPKANALDVACGSGDSSAALKAIAAHVVGTDISAPMLQLAGKHCDEIIQLSAEQLPELHIKFDLISVCMAFHWFDQERVIPAFKAVTKAGGYWLIYNVAFAGQPDNADFKKCQENYLWHYPTPARHSRVAAGQLSEDAQVKTLATLQGSLDVAMDQSALIGYLSTQSNVEAAVNAGKSYVTVEAQLKDIFAGTDDESAYQFDYTVELYQFNPRGDERASTR